MTPREYEDRYGEPVGRCHRHGRAVVDNQCDDCEREERAEMVEAGERKCDWCGVIRDDAAGVIRWVESENAYGCAKCLAVRLNEVNKLHEASEEKTEVPK